MKTRVLTGIAILVPSVYLLGWSPKWLFLAVLIALVERGLYEYFFIAQQNSFPVFPAAGYAGGAAVCAAQWVDLRYGGRLEFAVLIGVLLLVSAGTLWKIRELKQYLGCVCVTLFGIYYVAFTFSCLFPLRFSGLGVGLANGRQIVFFLFAVICIGDIFAYFTGRALGRRLLFPRVSPKKTVEGALGGLGASVALGWAWAHWFWQTDTWELAIVLAVCVAVAGQVGDFVESAMKRGARIKDSGAILPGHGGLLDRVDSLLFGAPVLWLALAVRSFIHH